MEELLAAGKHDEGVAFFLQDIVSAEDLENSKRTLRWAAMTAVAPTLQGEWDEVFAFDRTA